MKITSNIPNTGGNLCADRGFTGIETVEELYKNDLTFVGTIKTNRKGPPTLAKNIKGRDVYYTEFHWKTGSPLMSVRSQKG